MKRSSVREAAKDFIVRTVDTANRELVAHLKVMNRKLDIINCKFADRLTISRVQLALIIAVPAIGGAVGQMVLKLIWLGLLHRTW